MPVFQIRGKAIFQMQPRLLFNNEHQQIVIASDKLSLNQPVRDKSLSTLDLSSPPSSPGHRISLGKKLFFCTCFLSFKTSPENICRKRLPFLARGGGGRIFSFCPLNNRKYFVTLICVTNYK